MTTFLTTIEAMNGDCRAPSTDRADEPSCGQTYWDLIDRSDDSLLDFDTDALEHDDIDHARALLARHPATYRNQLTIARFLEGWIARIVNDGERSEFNNGFVHALLETAIHLRDGDFAAEPGDQLRCNGHAGRINGRGRSER